MENEPENINDLLVKYLAGETSESENQQVLAWLAIPGNKKELESLGAAWNISAGADIVSDVDVDAAWKKVQARIHPRQETVVRNINEAPGYLKPKINWLLRIAAIMIPAIIISFLVWQSGKNDVKQTMLASGNTRIEQTLPDGSVIYLAPNSILEYPEAFEKDSRKVKLKGEAFFDVAKDANRPFTVALENAEVRVLGTSFNVRAFAKEKAEVVVESGKVQFSAINKIVLERGDKGAMDANGNISRIKADEVEFYSRKTKTLVFENTELKKVIEVLNSIYNTKLELENENLANCRLTSTFHDADIDSILEIIASTLELSISNNGETVKLSGKGCE